MARSKQPAERPAFSEEDLEKIRNVFVAQVFTNATLIYTEAPGTTFREAAEEACELMEHCLDVLEDSTVEE